MVQVELTGCSPSLSKDVDQDFSEVRRLKRLSDGY